MPTSSAVDTVGPVANPRIACDSGCQNGELKKTVAKLTLTVKHLDKNMAVISDALQKLSAKVVIQTISIIEPNADIVLPDLPLKSVAEVCDLNCRLLDMKFHDQMVKFFLVSGVLYSISYLHALLHFRFCV